MTGTGAGGPAVRLQQRDIDGLVLCGEHGGAPYDLLGRALDAQPARVRGIVARWRRSGYAATGSLGPGPAWCWLTPAGMTATGLGYRAGPPPLARIGHARAVLAARLHLAAMPEWAWGRPWWQSERRIRAKAGPAGGAHRPDAEVWWPPGDGAPYPGEVWAVEVELTPKQADRTVRIMTMLGGCGAYHRVLYFTAPAARSAVTRAAAALQRGTAPVTILDLPPFAAAPAPETTAKTTRKNSAA